MKIVFKPAPGFEPDKRDYNGGKYQDTADKLRAMPGEWAVIAVADTPKQAQQLAANVRRGRTAAFRPIGDWEATTRINEVLARFVGKNKPGRR
jgi:hypothetical protein